MIYRCGSTRSGPVSTGAYSTIALTASGELYTWGRIGETTHTSPARVLGEQLGSATFAHACASELLAVAVATL